MSVKQWAKLDERKMINEKIVIEKYFYSLKMLLMQIAKTLMYNSTINKPFYKE